MIKITASNNQLLLKRLHTKKQ